MSQSEGLKYHDRRIPVDSLSHDWFRVCDPRITSIVGLNLDLGVRAIYYTVPPSNEWLDGAAQFYNWNAEAHPVRAGEWRIHSNPPHRAASIPILPLDKCWFEGCTDVEVAARALDAISAAIETATETERDGETVCVHPAIKVNYTGLRLLENRFPRKRPVQVLCEADAAIVNERMQSRQEFYAKPGKGRHFYYYDMKRFYQNIISWMQVPVGEPVIEVNPSESDNGLHLYTQNEVAFYHIKARVPDDWAHVGLVECRGTFVRKPGSVIDAWIPTSEMHTLARHEWRETRPHLPDRGFIGQSWNVRIVERLVFRDTSVTWPGKRAFEKFERLTADIENRLKDHPDFSSHIEYALKRMRYAPIAMMASKMETAVWRDIGEYRPAEIDITKHRVDFDDDNAPTRFRLVTKGDREPFGVYVPQVPATLWSEARAKMTLRLLELPMKNIIAVDNDAIFTTAPHEFYNPSGHPEGGMRLKGEFHGEYSTPTNMEMLKPLADRARRELNACKA